MIDLLPTWLPVTHGGRDCSTYLCLPRSGCQ